MSMAVKPELLDLEDLERSLPSDAGQFDTGLARWAIEMVSAAAVEITRQQWQVSADVPPGVMVVLAMAARRLYVNPDRFTREAEGDYSYAFDATVTKADVFTPAEIATLRDHSTAPKVKGLGTIGTYRGDLRSTSTIYVPDGTATGFPWYEEGSGW